MVLRVTHSTRHFLALPYRQFATHPTFTTQASFPGHLNRIRKSSSKTLARTGWCADGFVQFPLKGNRLGM